MMQRALHDPLTGLAQRALLYEFLHRCQIAHRRRPEGGIAVAFFDVGGLKQVNDEVGHHAGDQLLRLVAHRLEAAVRPGDLVARFGGDEFVIVLDHVMSAAEAARIIERALETVRRPAWIGGRRITPELHGGLVYAPDADWDTDQLIRGADEAMYEAKRAHSHEVVVRDGTGAIAALLDDLGVALHDGEVMMRVQPTVSLDTGEPVAIDSDFVYRSVGATSVTDLAHGSLLAPAGALGQLVEWAIDRWEALRDRPSLPLALELPAGRSSSLVDGGVVELLESRSVPSLAIGLPASSVTAGAMSGLDRLRRRGIALHLRGFGADGTSLGSLLDADAAVVHLDPSVIGGLFGDGRAERLIELVVGAAAAVSTNVVADGLVVPGQSSRLQELGVVLGQGPLFLAPVVPEVLGAELATGRLGRPKMASVLDVRSHRAIDPPVPAR